MIGFTFGEIFLCCFFQQLEEQVAALDAELKSTTVQHEMLVTRHERENQEGDNLVTMLRSDVDRLAGER